MNNLSAENAGYIIAGIFKLITGGGFGIWCAVDLIRILSHSFPDGNGMEVHGDFSILSLIQRLKDTNKR